MPVAAFAGRVHMYEGHSPQIATHAIQQVVEEGEDLLAGLAVERTRRLVGDNDLRVGDDRVELAALRDALLVILQLAGRLAAREIQRDPHRSGEGPRQQRPAEPDVDCSSEIGREVISYGTDS